LIEPVALAVSLLALTASIIGKLSSVSHDTASGVKKNIAEIAEARTHASITFQKGGR
jgi:hypothetical protein